MDLENLGRFDENRQERELLTHSESEFLNVLIPSEEIFTDEFQKLDQACALIGSEQSIKDFKDTKKLYLKPSPALNDQKRVWLSSASWQTLDLGVDPYSLGLWESQLIKSPLIEKEEWREGLRIFRISLLAYDMAGASNAQQLALCLASLDQLLVDYEGAYSAEELLALTSFEIPMGSNTLQSVVKLNGIRHAISDWIKTNKIKVTQFPKIFTIASPRELATREPWNNMLRLTSVNMAAHLAGVDGLVNIPFDLFSAGSGSRHSRNMNLILEMESHLNKVMDPTRGSFSLDDGVFSLLKQGDEFYQEIKKKEGLRQALRAGWIQDEIKFEGEKVKSAFLSRKIKMTGVNDFCLLESLSDEYPLVDMGDVLDIETWWSQWMWKSESEKLCDVERLIPQQLSSLFENWQFKADKVRKENPEKVKVGLRIEPGLENHAKVQKVQNLLGLGGIALGNEKSKVQMIVSLDPEGDFTKGQLTQLKDNGHQVYWVGEKEMEGFDGRLGEGSDFMLFFEKLFKSLEVM